MNRASNKRTAVVALGLGVVLGGCGPRPTPQWHQEQGYRWRELEVSGKGAGFTSMEGGHTGVNFTNDVSDSLLLSNRVLGQGAGVALGDVDGDGRPDIFLARTQGCSALYRNLGDWRFEDITRSAGVGACDRHSTGAAFADVDGDGDLDLVLVATGGPNAIFLNDGKGHFTEHRDLGLDTGGKGGTTITMADVDGDGLLDLYVANYKAYSLEDSLPPEQRAYDKMVRRAANGGGKYEVVPQFQHDYKLVYRPDVGGMRLSLRGEPDDFYHNDGGRFTRRPVMGDRFRDAQGKPMREETESFNLDAKFADLNGDGAPDLYVTADFEDPDQLWINDGRGSFHLADWTAQRQTSSSSMGLDVADVNGDGLPDVFVDDMLANDSKRLKTQTPTHTALAKVPGDMQTQLQQQRNTLFINRGDGTFAEVGMMAGVEASGWSWGALFLDVDLDGWQDLLVANGHLWDIMDSDTHERMQDLPNTSWQKLRWRFPPLRLPNVAFRNRGDLSFEDVSQQWHFGIEPDISHALAAADLDGDGDLDVVVNRLRSPALLLRNDAKAPRVAVRLTGAAPNTMAVGATVKLSGGATPMQEREVAAGGLYLSHSDYEMSFAMGQADSARLEVTWRDGRRTVLEVRPNRLYEISATTATAAARSPAVSADSQPSLFSDSTTELGGHVHVDPPFNDWARQYMLPNALSNLGPGIAWFDYDGDGEDDLLVGAGDNGRLGVFRNDAGRLTPLPQQGPSALTDMAGIVGLPATDGRAARVLIATNDWEGAATARLPGVIAASVEKGAVSSSAGPVIPPSIVALGPLALGDYDGDGDLDLFVGGRAMPSRYPETTASGLFRNDGGTFVIDTAARAILRDVGLVSAATFADVDGDGHPDLLLARDWDSILLLLNRNGRFVPAPASWGLDRWTSRWNGIATGDLDGDGRLDIVATSWGRNTATPASDARPLTMFYGPFGGMGEIEMLLGRRDPRIKGLAPLQPYDVARRAIANLPARIATFAGYADATVDEVLGPLKSVAQEKTIVTMDHMIFLNRGDHFEAHPLAIEAQEAPAFYVGVADFDGDGAEDVFLSQNFSETAIGLPRYDAGRGLLLRGDGKGGLTPMTGRRSGIIVYGDQRGAAYADFNGDGRLDLAVSQNASSTRLFVNQGAKPGLRVRVRGTASNPDAIGAQVRLVFGDRMGPVREIQAGSGYWSENGSVQVFGYASPPSAVWVRWPGGGESRVAVPTGAREAVVQR